MLLLHITKSTAIPEPWWHIQCELKFFLLVPTSLPSVGVFDPGPVLGAFHCALPYQFSQGTCHSSPFPSKTWSRLDLLWQWSYKVWKQLTYVAIAFWRSIDVCPSLCSLWETLHTAKERLHSLTHASFPFIFRNTSAGCRYHTCLPPQLWGISIFWREKSYFRVIFLLLISELWQGPHSNTF